MPDTSGTGRTPRRRKPADARAQGRTTPRSGGRATGGGGRTPGRSGTGAARAPRPGAPSSSQRSNRSAATFRRRRLIAVVLALVLVAGLAVGGWAVVGAVTGSGDDGATAPAPSTAASPSTTTPAETTEPAEPETTEPAIGSTPPQPTACTADQATLAVGVPSSARAGSGVTFSLDVATTSDVPCLVDLGSGTTTIEISSGDDLVWTSAQCAYAPSERRLLLGEDATDSQDVTWAGTRSAQGCPGGQPVAEAGTYRVVATHVQDGARLVGEATVVLR